MSRKTTLEKKKRIWEVDALRGVLIFLVLFNHLLMTVEAFCIDGLYRNFDPYAWVDITDPFHVWFDWGTDGVIHISPVITTLRNKLNNPGVGVFFLVSGVSYGFSRNHLKNAIRLLCGAAFVSLFTKLLVFWTGDENQFIRFGVLHCYAMCHLIHYFLLEDRSDKVLLIVAVVAMLIGCYLRKNPVFSDSALLIPFGIMENGTLHRDYWPIFPMLGWFLAGVVLERHFYSEKKTLFPGLETKKWHRPLCFLGRNSGLIYCGHMVLYTLMFCGIGHILNLY